MVREDDYTGHIIDEFDTMLEPTDEVLFEWDEDDEIGFDDDYDITNETIIRISDVVDGVKTLQEVAERLYDYADELLSMATLGWELVDNMSGDQGVAILFDDVEDADLSEDGEEFDE